MSKPLTMTEGREELIREVIAESVRRAETGGTLYAAPLLTEIDALRAALAAAESALADERKHADVANDILTRLRHASYEFHNEGNHECVDAWLDIHAARRNAEKEDKR